jgi:hypothetical protein
VRASEQQRTLEGNHRFMNHDAQAALGKLVAYCRANGWAGYDPYDALNSRLFKALPLLNSRIPQIALTQALKRSPINVRRLALVAKTQNPKALGLFLAAFVKLSDAQLADRETLIEHMIERLMALRSRDNSHWCWGYSFPWQTRTIVVPVGAPNVVCTTFVADALLDTYEQRRDKRCLNMAVSAAEYIRDVLYWEDGELCGFSYPLPGLRGTTHNANLMAGALLCRIYRHIGDPRFLAPAFRVARYSAAKQREDGSWWYGEEPTQHWIDNFHTGYNLLALRAIGRYAETAEFEEVLRRGFEFYRANFFRADGAAKYFHNRTYPLDIHAVAQSIITLLAFKDLDPTSVPVARSVYEWAMNHMWDERGFFYYRVLRLCTIRTSYMRWSQAWMVLALATLQSQSGESDKASQEHEMATFAKV